MTTARHRSARLLRRWADKLAPRPTPPAAEPIAHLMIGDRRFNAYSVRFADGRLIVPVLYSPEGYEAVSFSRRELGRFVGSDGSVIAESTVDFGHDVAPIHLAGGNGDVLSLNMAFLFKNGTITFYDEPAQPVDPRRLAELVDDERRP